MIEGTTMLGETHEQRPAHLAYDAMLRRLLWGETIDESWKGVLDNPRNPLAHAMPSEPMPRTEVSEAEVEAARIAIQKARINGQRQSFTDSYARIMARAALQAAATIRETKKC